ncbi:protein enabled homolog [Columba livia]|uniref:protein enabled homolog n=1 Tax=Columba livia TaxID=8932 RepID=UPI0031BB99F1
MPSASLAASRLPARLLAGGHSALALSPPLRWARGGGVAQVLADARPGARACRKPREKRGPGASQGRGRGRKVSSRGSNFLCFRVSNLPRPYRLSRSSSIPTLPGAEGLSSPFPASSERWARPYQPLSAPRAAAAASSGTGGPGSSASLSHSPLALFVTVPPPHLPCPTLTFPARPPRGSPPLPLPPPALSPPSPAEGVSHAAEPAEQRLSPCAHSAGAGSPAGFIRGQRRLLAAARLAANAAARLTLPRPGVTHGGPRQPPVSGSASQAGSGHVAAASRLIPRAQPPLSPTSPPPRPPLLLQSGINAHFSGKHSPFRHRKGGHPLLRAGPALPSVVGRGSAPRPAALRRHLPPTFQLESRPGQQRKSFRAVQSSALMKTCPG